MKNVFTLLAFVIVLQVFGQKTITFKASDGLEITADLYITNPETSPLILLFHQAGWSRGEYKEIAPKLNKLGYNCVAIDQRSGEIVNDVANETYKRALEQKKGTNYVDAYVDINSAIDYAKANYKSAKKLIIWGSSYSAGLVIKAASEREDVDAVIAFSPGEYYKKMGKPDDWIQSTAKKISVPVWITSMKLEKKKWWDIAAKIPSENRAYFLPTKIGKHGSRALWAEFSDSGEYWKALEEFLEVI
jgi:dienelactone hydrolase